MAKAKKQVVRRVATLILDTVAKPKKPRKIAEASKKTQFKKGNPYGFKKGQSGNPSGRPKGSGTKVVSEAYRIQLGRSVPASVARALGFDGSITWAEAMACGMIQAASRGEASAAKEVREVTEGRLPETSNINASIDYTAGASAKDVLVGKLTGKQG
jgi:hypothetical protein